MKKVSRKMTLGEAVQKYPEAAEIMMRRGLHCIGCGVARFETIEQGALAHGLTEKEIGEMVVEINKKLGGREAKK